MHSGSLRTAKRQAAISTEAIFFYAKIRDVLSKLSQAANTRVQDVLVTDEGLVVTLEREFPAECHCDKRTKR
jgi:hypothetical protein